MYGSLWLFRTSRACLGVGPWQWQIDRARYISRLAHAQLYARRALTDRNRRLDQRLARRQFGSHMQGGRVGCSRHDAPSGPRPSGCATIRSSDCVCGRVVCVLVLQVVRYTAFPRNRNRHLEASKMVSILLYVFRESSKRVSIFDRETLHEKNQDLILCTCVYIHECVYACATAMTYVNQRVSEIGGESERELGRASKD